MNQTELQTTGNGYTVATVGNLATFEGKAFVKDIVGTPIAPCAISWHV